MARGRRLPKFLRPDEVDALLEQTRCERDRMLLICALELGLRVSELVHLRVADVDFDERQVLVEQGKGDKDRYVPVARRLEPDLRAWVGDRRRGYLFPSPRDPGKPLTTRAVQYLVRNAAERAGVDRIQVTPHKMRHTFATKTLRRSRNLRAVQQLLGHSSIGTTEIYTHVVTDDLRDAVDGT